MNILITGSTGFVGTNLIPFLRENDSSANLFSLNRNRLLSNTASVDWDSITADWLNENDIESIIHLAGIAHDIGGQHKEEDYDQVNFGLTKKIFDLYKQSKSGQKFIFLSSVKAISDQHEGELTEDFLPRPATPYGISKLKSEKYIVQNKPDSKSVFVLRPAMIHGPGNKGNLNLLYRFVSKGIPYPLGLYENGRSYLFIDNLSQIILEILTADIASGVYNLCDDGYISTKALVNIMSEELSIPNRVINLPKWTISLISKVGDRIKSIPIDSQRLQKLTSNYKVSNEKIKRALKKQIDLNLEEGLRKTIRSFES